MAIIQLSLWEGTNIHIRYEERVFEILYFVSAFLKHYSEKSCINQAKLFHFGHILYFYGEKKIEVYANRAYKAK